MDKSQGGAQLTTLKGSELALGIQFSAVIGKEKSLTLTTGIPLDMEYSGINEILDKVARAMNRQEMMYRLADRLDDLEKYEKELVRVRMQAETYSTTAQAEWYKSGRKGEFQPRGQQASEIKNYENNERGIVEFIRVERIKIDELKKKIESL